MTEKNSPGLTLKETSSTAIIGPSAVSNCTTTLSATKVASVGAGARAIRILLALARHRRGRCSCVPRLDVDVDDGNGACFDSCNSFLKGGR